MDLNPVLVVVDLMRRLEIGHLRRIHSHTVQPRAVLGCRGSLLTYCQGVSDFEAPSPCFFTALSALRMSSTARGFPACAGLASRSLVETYLLYIVIHIIKLHTILVYIIYMD